MGGMSQRKPASRKANHFIKEWRKHRRVTQEGLAEKIGATSGAISQLENGLINYTQPTLEAIATALGCSPSDLLGGPPSEEDNSPEVALKTSLLAYGVPPEDLRTVMKIIKGFANDAAESQEQRTLGGQSELSTSRRAKAPS